MDFHLVFVLYTYKVHRIGFVAKRQARFELRRATDVRTLIDRTWIGLLGRFPSYRYFNVRTTVLACFTLERVEFSMGTNYYR